MNLIEPYRTVVLIGEEEVAMKNTCGGNGRKEIIHILNKHVSDEGTY